MEIKLTGLKAWLPTDNQQFFGTDRTLTPTRFNTPVENITYYRRLKNAVKAAINAWKYGT